MHHVDLLLSFLRKRFTFFPTCNVGVSPSGLVRHLGVVFTCMSLPLIWLCLDSASDNLLGNALKLRFCMFPSHLAMPAHTVRCLFPSGMLSQPYEDDARHEFNLLDCCFGAETHNAKTWHSSGSCFASEDASLHKLYHMKRETFRSILQIHKNNWKVVCNWLSALIGDLPRFPGPVGFAVGML